MFVVLVHFQVEQGFKKQFHEALRLQAQNSIEQEEHCHVFDVCQSNDNPLCFVLYELYSDEAAFNAHLESAHFHAFDQRVSPWVTSKSVQLMTRTSIAH